MLRVLIIGVMISLFSKPAVVAQKTIYEFKMPSLTGETIDFNGYKGKWILIVNTASKCGFTPQYAELEKLHETYGDRVAVLGFPANNFLWQEPGSNQQIQEFCTSRFGVRFQMFSKISVKGSDKHALYKWLELHSGGKTPSWNFCKYLVSPEGKVVGFFSSGTSPLDEAIVGKIAPN